MIIGDQVLGIGEIGVLAVGTEVVDIVENVCYDLGRGGWFVGLIRSFMGNGHQSQGSIKYRPAKGLLKLTWRQVEELDRRIYEVCEAGHGTVEITVERGQPLFVSPRPSYRLEPARAEGLG